MQSTVREALGSAAAAGLSAGCKRVVLRHACLCSLLCKGAPAILLKFAPVACRADTVRQLLEPLYVLLTQLNAQLAPAQGAAQPWATLAPWADPQLTHHLTKVRVLLDAMSLAAERAGGSDGGGSGGGVRTDHEAAAARAGSGAAAAPAGDERMERESSGSASPPPRTASGRASSSGGAGEAAAAPSSRDAGSGGDAAGSGAGSGSRPGALEQQHGPVLRLIMAELWPQLHALCSAGASGRFLHALAKCCSAVLRSPGAGGTQPVLEQLLPLCAACFARPGGACLAEPLAAAVEMVGGGGGGLSGPLGGAVVRVRGGVLRGERGHISSLQPALSQCSFSLPHWMPVCTLSMPLLPAFAAHARCDTPDFCFAPPCPAYPLCQMLGWK